MLQSTLNASGGGISSPTGSSRTGNVSVDTAVTGTTQTGFLNPVMGLPYDFARKQDTDEYGPLPQPADLAGKTPEEIDKILQEKGIPAQPTRDGNGVKYPVPGRPGDQVRLQPGNPKDPDPAKRVPYGRVSENGKISEPFPINGSPKPSN